MTDTAQHIDTANLDVENIQSTIKFEDFTKSIPQELKALYEKNGVKDFEGLKKDYEGFNSLKGKKGLVKPADDASDEVKQAYQSQLFKEIGVPENGEYEYELPETVKEEWVDQSFVDELAGIAADNGVSTKAFQEFISKVYGKYADMVNQAMEANSIEIVKKEWGDNFDDNLKLANTVLKKYAGVENAEKFVQKFGQDPDAIKFFYNLAKANKEKAGVLDDGDSSASKADLSELARAKTLEAIKLRDAGNFAAASKAQQEAYELQAKLN